MKILTQFGGILLATTALYAPAAMAQGTGGTQPGVQAPPSTAPGQADPAPQTQADPAGEQPAEEQDVEISAPGASPTEQGEEIIVTGRFIPNSLRRNPQVISVLSSEDIARTGEGDIAGALQRVTGLSVVGGRFVFVRGLGERYSLALLNGLPLPSPEPLRRTVPLDIFPTSVIASTLVQKTYSAPYPGEFGGGVINLTTVAVPDEPYLTVGVSVGGDSITTFNLGYTYFGSETDFTSFDGGEREIPGPLQAAINSGNLLVPGQNFTLREVQDITASLSNARTSVIQRNFDIQPNFGASLAAGTSIDVHDGILLGVNASLNYSNSWQTKGGIQQSAIGISVVDGQPGLTPDVDYRFLSTENRLLLNGLLGFGLEIGDHRIRWTNLYIRDVLKEARIQQGFNFNAGDETVNVSNTAWFERVLFTTQMVGEFRFGPFSVDLRGAYARTDRESPYERTFSYEFDPAVGDFVNDLRENGQNARVSFSDLKDTIYSGAIDLSYALPTANDIIFSAGYSYLSNDRNSIRRDFRYSTIESLPQPVTQLRPDFLLSDFNLYTYGIFLVETSGSAGAAAYEADLEVHAGYVQGEVEPFDGLRVVAGVRYEDGRQSVTPIDLFGLGGEPVVSTTIEETYWLPTITATWNFAPDMQFRLHASQTIARPQFRELAPQQFLDPETDRTSFGNQFLTDSELMNAEARYEWYFGRDQRFALAGFYKNIDRPIESYAFAQGGNLFSTFANAPAAQLYGVEVELQRYTPLDFIGNDSWFTTRRLVTIANYTYSQSEIRVSEGDTTIPVGTGGQPRPATLLFDDGDPLTGQSEHILNLQLGLESTERLSQQTILVNYASERVTNRGLGDQPDLIEEPGWRLDFVWREGVRLFGSEAELKLEVRNILGEDYEEYQELNETRIDNNSYDVGTSASFGISFRF